MNREIKFRAWNKDKEVFIDNFLITNDGEVLVVDEFETPKKGLTVGWKSAENVILMQYTGLKDKNSKEIYEGDILNGDKYDDGRVFVVSWRENDCCFEGVHKEKDELGGLLCIPITSDREVIGNIYENPEFKKLSTV